MCGRRRRFDFQTTHLFRFMIRCSVLFSTLSFLAGGPLDAGTVIRTNTPGANGMGAQNAAVPAGFGDFIALAAPGNAVFATYAGAHGVTGTPDVDLGWSSSGGTNANRWEFHAWAGAGAGNTGGGVLQMDGSAINSRYSITFTPAAGVAVILKSFNFVGDTNGDSYQYRVDVVNTATNAVEHTQTTASWTTNTAQNPSANGTFAGAPQVTLDFTGSPGVAYRLDLVRIGGAGANSAVNIAVDNIDFDQSAPPNPGLPPTVDGGPAGPTNATALSEEVFTFRATDPEGADVQIQVDWGDGRISEWSPPAASGSERTFPRAYPHSGGFVISARARDVLGGTSGWVAIQPIEVAAASGIPDGLVGLWEFDEAAAPGKASHGADLVVVGAAPVFSAALTDGAPEPVTLDGVISTAGGTANRLLVSHGIGANGYGSKVNRYTLVYDVLVPGTGQWRGFYQTTLANNDDGEYFVRNSDNSLGVGALGYSTRPLPANRWHRLVLSVDLTATGNFRAYLDGQPFFTHIQPALDGRFALDPAQVLFFADDNNENQPLSVGMAAVFAKALTADEVDALGTPGMRLIAPPGNRPPVLSAGPAGPAAGETGASLALTVTAADPDGDAVQVQADWGDGRISPWTPFGTAGQARTIVKAWGFPGNYLVKARTRDINGAVSEWSGTHGVEISGPPMITFRTPPYLQNMSRTSMVVMAEIEEDLPLVVQYGHTEAFGSAVAMESVASGGGSFFYRAVLTGLAAGTTYHFRLATPTGDGVASPATFRTAPAGWEDFSLGVLGDTQTTNGDTWQADPWEPAKLMLADMIARGVAFGLGLGDHASDGNSYTSTRNSHLLRWGTVFGPHRPFFISWGNHDGSSPSHPLRLSADMPSRWQAGDSPSTRTPGYGNYWFSYSGVFFVCLEYFQTHNRAAGDQANDLTNGWLDGVLSSPEARSARFRIVAVHVPPYCERWINGDANLRAQLVPRMEKHGVDLCLSGHMHGYERGRINGVQYVISGSGSYLDFNEPLVANRSAITDDGVWLGGHVNVPGSYARQSSPGVLGPPLPIVGGLFHGYTQITVRDRYMRLDQHGFNADGSYIGILDTIELGGPDPGPDSDGDGMRDAWELANGLDPHDPSDALIDSDGDGQNNLAEFLAGTDPRDPGSVFRAILPDFDGGNSMLLTWSSVPGRRYRIEISDDLTGWLAIMDDDGKPLVIEASAGPATDHRLSLEGEPRKFVRVVVAREGE